MESISVIPKDEKSHVGAMKVTCFPIWGSICLIEIYLFVTSFSPILIINLIGKAPLWKTSKVSSIWFVSEFIFVWGWITFKVISLELIKVTILI